jgi:hypothetical protein
MKTLRAPRPRILGLGAATFVVSGFLVVLAIDLGWAAAFPADTWVFRVPHDYFQCQETHAAPEATPPGGPDPEALWAGLGARLPAALRAEGPEQVTRLKAHFLAEVPRTYRDLREGRPIVLQCWGLAHEAAEGLAVDPTTGFTLDAATHLPIHFRGCIFNATDFAHDLARREVLAWGAQRQTFAANRLRMTE